MSPKQQAEQRGREREQDDLDAGDPGQRLVQEAEGRDVQPEVEGAEVQEPLGLCRAVKVLKRGVGVLRELTDLGRHPQDLGAECDRRPGSERRGRCEFTTPRVGGTGRCVPLRGTGERVRDFV
jgi:hypothetical protein